MFISAEQGLTHRRVSLQIKYVTFPKRLITYFAGAPKQFRILPGLSLKNEAPQPERHSGRRHFEPFCEGGIDLKAAFAPAAPRDKAELQREGREVNVPLCRCF